MTRADPQSIMLGMAPDVRMDQMSTEELAEVARQAVRHLAESGESAAFLELISLSGYVGEMIGVSARTLASAESWARVGSYAGTSRQSAWERWAKP